MTSSDRVSTALPSSKENRFFLHFFRYLIPSIIALLSVSSATIVDGLMVARFIGHEAVSAVNLLIPPLTFMFGLSLMFAIGNAVQATYYLGQAKNKDVQRVFSNTALVVGGIAIVAVTIAYVLQESIFSILGAPEEILIYLRRYFSVLLIGVPFQLLSVVFYYFIRSLGYPRQATWGLMLGASINIVLDVIFLGVLKLDIASAAWATVMAQITQFSVLLWVVRSKGNMVWKPSLHRIKEVFQAAMNGLSEFINEISVGIVIGVMHWILGTQYGVDALAGFALVNYGVFLNVMICCAVAEVVYTLASQRLSVGDNNGAKIYRHLSIGFIFVFSCAYSFTLIVLGPKLFLFLYPESAAEFAEYYLKWIWPAFILCGFNMVISAWFTGCQMITQSTLIAMSRSLILPLIFLWVLMECFNSYPPVFSFVLAEILTVMLSIILLWVDKPRKLHVMNS